MEQFFVTPVGDDALSAKYPVRLQSEVPGLAHHGIQFYPVMRIRMNKREYFS
jgi:hypothetical protein